MSINKLNDFEIKEVIKNTKNNRIRPKWNKLNAVIMLFSTDRLSVVSL